MRVAGLGNYVASFGYSTEDGEEVMGPPEEQMGPPPPPGSTVVDGRTIVPTDGGLEVVGTVSKILCSLGFGTKCGPTGPRTLRIGRSATRVQYVPPQRSPWATPGIVVVSLLTLGLLGFTVYATRRRER